MPSIAYIILIAVIIIIFVFIAKKIKASFIASTITRIIIKMLIVLMFINLLSLLINGAFKFDWLIKPDILFSNLLSIKWLQEKIASIFAFVKYIFNL